MRTRRHGWSPSLPQLLSSLGAGLLLSTTALGAQGVSLDTIIGRASDYAAEFFSRFANVVTEEHLVQDLELLGSAGPFGRGGSAGPQARQHRELRSDLLIVSDGGSLAWMLMRDVFEVDGKPVRDHEDRLSQLLAQPDPDTRAQAERIANESARYNLGPGTRTTNTPELSMLFLQPSVHDRFTFSLGPREGSVGDRVWVVNYKERARPTIVRDQNDKDLPASGRFWIDVDTGRVLRAEATLRPPGVTWTLTTVFKFDERYGVAVPSEMRELYDMGATRVVGTATYGRYRSFTVSTDEAVTAK